MSYINRCSTLILSASCVIAVQAASADDMAEIKEVIVTGTRQEARTVAESLAPIDVLSAEELRKSGKQSTRDLVATLVPSVSVSNSGAGASFAVKTVSLRGLSGDQTLVLVNGKRRHNSAVLFINGTTQNGQSPPDLDLIPVSAIERIEVLRDGASAQYGSDALAGVINIILKETAHGGNATAVLGTTGEGDGEASQLYGDAGFALGDGGHLHLSANGSIQQRTDRGTLNTSQLYFPINGQPDPREAAADRRVNHPGQPHVKTAQAAYDMSLPVGESATFYSFATGAARDADSWLTYRNPNASNNNQAIYPDGYVPHLFLRDRDGQVAVGLRGKEFLGVDWDLSSTISRDQVSYHETTALNASLGPASPTDFYIGKLTSKEWTNNLELSRLVETKLGTPLAASAGLEYRRNEYAIGAGEPASYINGGYRAPDGPLKGVATQPGSQGVTGFPADAAGSFSRHNSSVYMNFEQKLTQTFEMGLAGRHERYSDFGNTTTGKLSMRYEPFEGYGIRGTVSKGFRAPTLAQEHYASSSTIGVRLTPTSPNVLYPVRTLPVDSPAAIALGATPLRPEKSTNYSLGLVLQPTSSLDVTLDMYKIEIDDRILLTGTLVGSAVSAALASAGLDPQQGGFYFTNAADTTTRGVDLVTTYRSNFGSMGSVKWSFSANYNKTEFDRIESPPPQLASSGLVLIDRARQGDFTKGTPRDKYILGAAWSLNQKLETNLRITRYGKVTQVSATGPQFDDTISPKVLVDLDIEYSFTDSAQLTIGANNLFNKYPNVLMPSNQGVTGFSYYNPYSPFGISGGFYYSRLTYRF
jgi:iron complex outermembrane receptor protein